MDVLTSFEISKWNTLYLLGIVKEDPNDGKVNVLTVNVERLYNLNFTFVVSFPSNILTIYQDNIIYAPYSNIAVVDRSCFESNDITDVRISIDALKKSYLDQHREALFS